MQRTYTICLSLIIISALVLLSGCADEGPEYELKDQIVVKTAAVQQTEIQDQIRASGMLNSSQTSKLSFKVGGIIKMIAVDNGQSVQKGQLLAELFQDEIQAQLTSARTQYEKALRDYERANNLYQDEAISLQQKQDAKSGLDAAKASLQIARFNANRTKIVAPTHGKVLSVINEENEMVSAGTPVVLFASLVGDWVVNTHVADKDVVKLAVADSASITLDAFPGQTFPAKIREISGTADPVTGLYAVELTLQKQPDRLVNGLVAGVDIYPAHKILCYLVPADALYKARGKQGTVMTLNVDKIARENAVEIIDFYDDMLAVVGDLDDPYVITTGVSYVQPGDTVNVVSTEVAP